MNDEQLRQQFVWRAWEERQQRRAERLGRRKGAGRKPRPKPVRELPPPPTEDEYARWLGEQQ